MQLSLSGYRGCQVNSIGQFWSIIFQYQMKIDDFFRTVLFKDFYLLESFCNDIYSCNFHLDICKFYVIWIDRLFILLSQTSCLPMTRVGSTLNVAHMLTVEYKQILLKKNIYQPW